MCSSKKDLKQVLLVIINKKDYFVYILNIIKIICCNLLPRENTEILQNLDHSSCLKIVKIKKNKFLTLKCSAYGEKNVTVNLQC